MKIIIDENIIFAKEAFSPYGNVILKSGREITKSLVKDADALITRSITQINSNLLSGSRVQFIGTATIGIDHVNTDYLKKEGIGFANAAGCNSQAVAEYVFTALTYISQTKQIPLLDKTIGVIGAGNIGSKVVKMSKALGLKVLINDPPLQRKTKENIYCSLKEALTADIITLHVPITYSGIDKTFHLIDEKQLTQIKKDTIFLNSSRGPVVNNKTMIKILKSKNLTTIFDVWENEPEISTTLLSKVDIGTPHIAGYSFEGKVNGTKMIYDAFCKFFNLELSWNPNLPEISNKGIEINIVDSIENALYQIFKKVYPINEDSNQLKKMVGLPKEMQSKYFDKLRKEYRLRRELSNYTVILPSRNRSIKEMLQNFGLNIIEK
ncbi:erythronate-4-phosphate dehydrogenase [bacterium BMS3Abin04]|nr:erythronate-4-phosphate dehydrogenase [bacterium BMS3Abin04]